MAQLRILIHKQDTTVGSNVEHFIGNHVGMSEREVLQLQQELRLCPQSIYTEVLTAGGDRVVTDIKPYFYAVLGL